MKAESCNISELSYLLENLKPTTTPKLEMDAAAEGKGKKRAAEGKGGPWKMAVSAP